MALRSSGTLMGITFSASDGYLICIRRTLAGQNDAPLIDRVKKMVVAFQKYGVSQDMLERRLKRKIESMTADDFAEYIGIYNAIKGGESKVADWFEAPTEATELTAALKEE